MSPPLGEKNNLDPRRYGGGGKNNLSFISYQMTLTIIVSLFPLTLLRGLSESAPTSVFVMQNPWRLQTAVFPNPIPLLLLTHSML